MPLYTDQLNQTVEIPYPPKRIISLVPSQTELLFYLGLEREVLGITKFCIHPDVWFRSKERVGGTKNLHLEKIAALQPDLIIANKEENVREQIEHLQARFPVWVSDVNNLEDACEMIKSLGKITGRTIQSSQLVSRIWTAFSSFPVPALSYKVAYLIWKDPYMTVGGDTFIHHMLQKAGFQNVFAERLRYPAITLPEIEAAGCQVLLLSSEPYPFREKHVAELQQQLPGVNILLVDGEIFSWYGSRLLQAPPYFQRLHQQLEAMV